MSIQYDRIAYRRLTPADEPLLWEMLYQAIYVAPDRPLPEGSIVKQPELARYVEGWGRTGDSGVAAIEQSSQQPVGAAWLRRMTGKQRGYGYVDNQTPELSIALLPKYRGLGIGTQMITRLLLSAKTRYTAVSLSVSADNPARRLYERLGFAAVSDDGESVTMKLDLASRLPIELEEGWGAPE